MSFITGRPAVVVACSRSETGIIWRPNIYDRVLLLDRGSSPLPDTVRGASERHEGATRIPITMCPDLTVIRGPGISSATG